TIAAVWVVVFSSSVGGCAGVLLPETPSCSPNGNTHTSPVPLPVMEFSACSSAVIFAGSSPPPVAPNPPGLLSAVEGPVKNRSSGPIGALVPMNDSKIAEAVAENSSRGNASLSAVRNVELLKGTIGKGASHGDASATNCEFADDHFRLSPPTVSVASIAACSGPTAKCPSSDTEEFAASETPVP